MSRLKFVQAEHSNSLSTIDSSIISSRQLNVECYLVVTNFFSRIFLILVTEIASMSICGSISSNNGLDCR